MSVHIQSRNLGYKHTVIIIKTDKEIPTTTSFSPPLSLLVVFHGKEKVKQTDWIPELSLLHALFIHEPQMHLLASNYHENLLIHCVVRTYTLVRTLALCSHSRSRAITREIRRRKAGISLVKYYFHM